jgi:hypothetical protein
MGQFNFNAFVNPNDPSKLYAQQPKWFSSTLKIGDLIYLIKYKFFNHMLKKFVRNDN